jgi:nucleoside-diphosphate-sugar epimerase
MILRADGSRTVRIVVIGGTGHIGSYLTPRLAAAGYAVICVARGLRSPYREDAAWKTVERVEIDRDLEENTANFGNRIASLDANVIVDLTCYRLESAEQLVNAIRPRIEHLLHCGTIWVHGSSTEVPTTENVPRTAFGEYGIRKAAIERYLLNQAELKSFPVTVLHPGHLVGPGWHPINPQGNFNPKVFAAIAQGREIALPNFGMETLHHVHADDVAQAFMKAIERRSFSLGESFHVVSSAALTLRGFAERMAEWFGQQSRLRFMPWEEWRTTVSQNDARVTFDHITHSPNCSIAKASQRLAYTPRYSSLQAVQEAVAVMRGTEAFEND